MVYFNPLVPFGMNNNGYPIGNNGLTGNNQGNNCAPINPYFLGWTNWLNAINAVLGAAKGYVNVYELELQQEINTQAFTALIRYFYDNSIPASAPSQYVVSVGNPPVQYANILAALRGLMSANQLDPGRVTYSAAWQDASTATQNCTNVYQDYARNGSLDVIAQTINGGPVGVPAGYTPGNGLLCGGSITSFMYTSPIYSTQPDIVDVHMYPSVTGTTNTDSMIQQVAALDYGDVPHFLIEAGLTSADIVIGETYGGTLSPLNLGTSQNPSYCWMGTYQSPSGAPNDSVAGFNSSSLASYTVTFRPWMELEDSSGQCFAYGNGPGTANNYQGVNYNGGGPYTPTHP